MANENQEDTRRRPSSQAPTRPNQAQNPGQKQGQKGERQTPRRDENPQGQQPQRDKQRQAGNQRPGQPEIGDPVPKEDRRPRDLPTDETADDGETRQAQRDDDVERERDRPNPRLQ